MSWVQSLQSFLPFQSEPERRSPREIQNDLDDEFAFHIEQRQRDLIKEGLDPDAARGLAHQRFGNIEAIKRQCQRIALKERIMLQRVNFVLMIVVTLMVIGVGVQVFVTQRYNTLALQDITTQLANMRTQPGVEFAPPQPRAHLMPGDHVTLEVFELMKPGEWYRITREVGNDGGLRFPPMVGEVDVHGRTPRDVEEEIRQSIASRVMPKPQVSLFVSRWNPAASINAEMAGSTTGSASRGAARLDDDEIPKLSPFTEVRWDDWTPFVNVSGTWGELIAIDEIPVAEIIDFCKRTYPGKERKRFTEDLVQVLTNMGKRPGRGAAVQIKEVKTGTFRMLHPSMSLQNRSRVWEANRNAEEVPPGYPVWRGEPEQSSMLDPQQIDSDLEALAAAMRERFSYLHLRGVNFEEALQSLRGRIGVAPSIEQLALEVQRFICRFGDGHAGVSGLEKHIPPPFTPFLIGDAGGRLIAFQQDRSGFIDPDHPVVVSMNGIAVERLLESAAELVADGSPALRRGRSIRNLRYLGLLCASADVPVGSQVEIELESQDGASRRKVALPVSMSKPIYGDWPVSDSRVLESNVGYLRLAMMNRETASAARWMMQEFGQTRGLIIDVRGNGGGDRKALLKLLPFFMPPEAPPHVINVAAYRLSQAFARDHLAARFLYRRDDPRWNDRERAAIDQVAAAFKPAWTPPSDEFSEWHYLVISRPSSDDSELYYYDKPVVVLLDEGCFSATDIFLSAFQGMANVTLLGTPSSGGSGRKQSVRLPNCGLTISLSSMISYRPDGSMFDLTGIEPDALQARIATDFIGQSDSQLNAAVALILDRQ